MLVLGNEFQYIKHVGPYWSIDVNDNFSAEARYLCGIKPCNESDDVVEHECQNDFNVSYKYDGTYWDESSSWDKCDGSMYPELQQYHNKIIKYMNDSKELRSKLGMSSMISVGLISQPGMGKSTLIRMLATTLEKELNIVENKSDYNFINLDGILIVEDYDRYDDDSKIRLEQAINELNSYTNTEMPLIIYTSNTCLPILDLTFKFEGHSRETYKRSVDIIFDDGNDRLVDALYNSKISMREANALLCAAYSSKGCPVDYIKKNINTLQLGRRVLSNEENIWF